MADETTGKTHESESYEEPRETSSRESAPSYRESAPELGALNQDYIIPGVDPSETDPYRWHTGEKRDHGGEDSIEIIDLVKQFGRTRILNGLNLGLPNDQISMVLGPSGTGKSVLIKHIVGLLYPDAGDVLVHGESVPNLTDDELFEMRKKFGLLFQDGALFGSMDVFDNTAFPLRQHTDKSEDEIAEICNRRLREVGLAEAMQKMPNELSGGMRKRAGFARALVLDPAIVMFDEPDSGLDPVRTALLCELIREIHEENGGCYLVISHDLGTARRIADFLAVLWKGRIVESGPADELFEMRKKFGLLFQDGALFGSMNVFDNTAFPLRQHTDKSEDEIAEICNRRLREVGLAEAMQKMPNELSGGMRKRAGFARALVLDPAIVMFDEPDSGLDPVRTALL
jgi:phospholipid/cholesterol/gamma-HCH transport system ATP-binding protein